MVSAADVLVGGAGTDTLTISVSGGALPQMSDIENLILYSQPDAVDLDLSASTITGLTSVTLSNAGGTTSLTLGAGQAVSIENTVIDNAGTDIELNYGATITTASVTLNKVTSAGTSSQLEIDGNGLVSATITTTGTASTIDNLMTSGSAALIALTVAGDKNLTITDELDAAIATVDASAMTGGLSIKMGAVAEHATNALDAAITGGSGNDTIVTSGMTGTTEISVNGGAGDDTVRIGDELDATGDTFNGGDGTDILQLTLATNVTSATIGAKATNFETLQGYALTSEAGDTATSLVVSQDVSLLGSTIANVGVTTWSRTQTSTSADGNDETYTDGVTFDNVGADANLSLSGLAVTSFAADANDGLIVNFTATVDLALDNATGDDITVTLGTSTAAAKTVTGDDADTAFDITLALADYETITVVSQGAANTVAALTSADATSLIINASKAFTLTDIASGTSALKTIDASASTANVVVGASDDLAMTITGGSGNDTFAGGSTAANSISGGSGNDSLTGGSGNDVLDGGDGNDTITADAGSDSISGGAGNDTITLAGNLTSADTIDGGDGTDTLSLTIGTAALTAGALTSIEAISATFTETSAYALALASATGVTAVTIAHDGDADVSSVTGIVSGATVTLSDIGATVALDTAAAADLSINVNAVIATSVTVTDAASVTVKNTSAVAGTTTALILDAVDTTSLTVTGGALATVATGDVTGTAALTSIGITTSTLSMTAGIGAVEDAEVLTSLTVAANRANASTGAIGGTVAAEVLATVTATADNGATATLGGITADTANSTTDLAMVLTGTAGSGSTVALGAITNTYGTIALTASGAGTVGSGILSADDITATISSGGTYTELEATDDVTLTATNSAALVITLVDTGATATGAFTATVSGTAAFEVSGVQASLGAMTVNGAAATGTVKVVGDAWTGTSTLTGGSGKDTLSGGTGADSISGGAGNDNLTGGDGNDTLIGGTGNDTLVLGGSGDDSVDGGEGNDTITAAANLSANDTIIGGDGTDTLTVSISGVSTTRPASVTGVEVLNLDVSAAGTFDARNVSADVTSVILSNITADATITRLNSAITAISVTEETDTTEDISVTYDTGSATDVTISLAGVAANVDVGDVAMVNNAAGFTVTSGGFAANLIDAVDAITATTVTFTAASKGLTQAGTVTATAAADINLNATGGALVMGTVVSDADVATVDIVASTAEANDLSITLLDVDHVRTINITASGAADITVSDIEMLGVDNDGSTNIATSIVIAANHADSVVTISALVPASNAVLDSLVLSGAGDINIGTGTALGANIDITSIDASDMTGSLTFDGSSINAAMTVVLGDADADESEANSITTGTAADDITGGSGDDTIIAGTGNNIVLAMAGDDSITGGTGAEELDGGDGDDTIVGAAGVDNLVGGAGNDVFYFDTSDVETNETISGGTGTDTLVVTTTTDFSTGVGAGATLLTAGGIEQVVITQGETATFLASQLTGQAIAFNEDAAGTTGLVIDASTAGTYTFASLTFASVSYGASTGNAFDDDADTVTITGASTATSITGTSIADSIVGGAGNDTLSGGSGNDTITGAAGGDSITGGAGVDTVIIGASGSAAVTTFTDTSAGSTLSTTGIDLITLVDSDDDIIDLSAFVADAAVFSALNETVTQVTTNASAGDSADINTFTGTYASGVFTSTAAADATALLIVWDTNGNTAGSTYNAIVIIGVTDLTAIDLDVGTFNV